jgi:hypothetical protein
MIVYFNYTYIHKKSNLKILLSLLKNDFEKYLKKVKETTMYYNLNVAKKTFKSKA